MPENTSRFNKLFGSGPSGLVISLALLYGAFSISNRIALPPISQNQSLLDVIFYISIVITVLINVWSIKSLPATARGNILCTTGAFKYVRHPLYAAFLSVFNFGLALHLNSYSILFWAILLHPVWHYVIRTEESLMIDLFGKQYREYQKKTGRFVPRLW